MNFAGLVVVAAGLFLVVVALRNTQNQVFPFFFNTSGAASGSSNPINTILGGNCPSGQANVMGGCRPDPHNCGNGFVWINVGPNGTCVKVVG